METEKNFKKKHVKVCWFSGNIVHFKICFFFAKFLKYDFVTPNIGNKKKKNLSFLLSGKKKIYS